VSELSAPPRQRMRRRADAQRSVGAILDAAANILNQNPRASIEEIAESAGLTRQTVYAHYPSRQALISAAIDRVSEKAVAEMDAADLDRGPPAEALLRLVNIGWRTYERCPRLLRMGGLEPKADTVRHEPVRERLERLAKRGQDAGVFDGQLSPAWLATVAMALGHAAGEDVAAGRMSIAEATAVLERSILRVFEGAANHRRH
jgi:AcrR family transcriptional regulator